VRKIRATRDRARQRGRNGSLVHLSVADQLPLHGTGDRAADGHGVARGFTIPVCQEDLVRHFGSHALTSPFLRISVGTDEEMSVLQENLEAWLKSA